MFFKKDTAKTAQTFSEDHCFLLGYRKNLNFALFLEGG